MSWQVQLSSRAHRDLRRIAEQDRRAIRDAIDRASEDSSSVDFKKLAGDQNRWRIRVGRWRVILTLDNPTGTMIVTRILPRDRAYR